MKCEYCNEHIFNYSDEETSKATYEEHLSNVHPIKKIYEITAKNVGLKIRIRGQVEAISRVKAIPVVVNLQCHFCEMTSRISIWDISDNFNPEQFNKFISSDLNLVLNLPCPSPGCERRSLKVKSFEYKNCYLLDIIDPISSLPLGEDRQWVKERNSLRLYFVTDTLEDIGLGLVDCCAYVVAIGKKSVREFCLVTDKVTQSQEHFIKYVSSESDVQVFKKYFYCTTKEDVEQLLNQIDGTICPLIVGRKNAKFLAALTQHSPLYYGKGELGVVKVIFGGDSHTGKSEIIRDIIQELSPLGSEYCIAETASRTGLSYKQEQTPDGSWQVKWGVLPQVDGMIAGLDGLHKWKEEDIMQLRETLVQGKIRVLGAAKGERFARVRIIGCLNLGDKIISYPNRFTALKDSTILNNHVDRNRWDWIYTFGEMDVLPGDVSQSHADYEKGVKERKIPREVWVNHVKWAWNLQPKDLRIPNELEDLLKTHVDSFIRDYNKSDIDKPFSHKFSKIYKRLVLSFLILTHNIPLSSDKLHSYVTFPVKEGVPTPHNDINSSPTIPPVLDGKLRNSVTALVDWFKSYLEKLLIENLEMNEILERTEELDVELEIIKTYLLSHENSFKVLNEIIFTKGIQQTTISEKLGIAKSHVSSACSELEARGLIDKGKMKATTKSMTFYRQYKNIFPKATSALVKQPSKQTLICSSCAAPVDSNYSQCPDCGKNLGLLGTLISTGKDSDDSEEKII